MPSKAQQHAADPGVLFTQRLNEVAAATEGALDRLLGPDPVPGERLRPARLLDAMRYAALGGGKRVRPFLVVETARLFDVPEHQAYMVAAALECVHCYSLTHDDLPSMDDDALRRGRPTTHKAFDEATAILVGDGLLTLAFEILSRPQTHGDATVRIALISALGRGAGLGGMIGGQMLDLAAEGRFEEGPEPLTTDSIRTLQSMKTGKLLEFACISGALLGKADHEAQMMLARYGAAIGEAFQVADDLLDVDGDVATVGKATGKDAAANKATFVTLLGVDGARKRLAHLVSEAEAALEPFGSDAAILQAAARFIAERRN